MTFLLATILRSSMRTAMRWRKSPINWKMSIFYVLLDYKLNSMGTITVIYSLDYYMLVIHSSFAT